MGPQTAASAMVYGYTDVANARTAGTNFTLNTTIIDAAGSGAVIGSSVTSQYLSPGGWVRAVNIINLGTVNLWNTEASYMYTARTEVIVPGEGIVDTFSTRIGIRDAIWTPNTGFTLNGYKLPVRGVSNHQDFGGAGVAVPDRINQYRVAGLRAIGVNFWRTAHNPTNPELLDFCGACSRDSGVVMISKDVFYSHLLHLLCFPCFRHRSPGADEQGMLLWVENRFINQGVQPLAGPKATPAPLPPNVAAADPQLLRDAQDMVLRDRNHPSVVIWSLWCVDVGGQRGAVGCTGAASISSSVNSQRDPVCDLPLRLRSNEGGCEIGNAKGGVIGAQFKEVINFADTTRPITGNSEWSVGSTDSLTQILDVMTCS